VSRALSDEATIQWFPGHMAKAMRRLADDLKLIDVVIEVVDARVPASGTNPALGRMIGKRARVVVLARDDQADPVVTAQWLERYSADGLIAIAAAAKDRSGVARIRAALEKASAGRTSSRAIVLGIPNAGKSTVINAIVGRAVARTEDRAGVTRAAQWFRVSPTLEIMDTAGILVPKIDTTAAQWKLAMIGAVPRARFDAEDVVTRFHRDLLARDPATSVPDLETFAQSRGFIRRGTISDTHNAAWSYIKDFNDGKFGRITLEWPNP
jgi:ribosome biogenesis GTPase A